MMPNDPEAEISILAEINERLHFSLEWVTAAHFYDRRHIRLFKHLRGEPLRVPLSEDDLCYLEHLTKYAWPITQSILERFVDTHAKRVRLLEIEAEREELLT